MPQIERSVIAAEKGTIVFTISFYDETPELVVPNSIAWSLLKGDESVVNLREDVSVSVDSTITITLSGDDLAVDFKGDNKRYLLIKALYDSSYGSDLPLRDTIRFSIDDLVGVS